MEYNAITFIPNLLYYDEVFTFINNNKVPGIIEYRYMISNYGRIYDCFTNLFVIGQTDTFTTFVFLETVNGLTKFELQEVIAMVYYQKDGQYARQIDRKTRSLFHKDNVEWTDDDKVKYDIHVKYVNGQRVHCGEGSSLEAKLNEKEVHEICSLLQENKLSLSEISKKYNVKNSTIFNIKSRKTWKHISKSYVFPEINNRSDGSNNGMAKYTDDQIREVCKLLEKNVNINEISRLTNVSLNVIKSVRGGRGWKYISKEYKLPFLTSETPKELYACTKYSISQVREVCELLEKNELRPMDIARKLGVEPRLVYSIKSNKSWKEISKDYNIQYANGHASGEAISTSKYSEKQIRKVCELLCQHKYTYKEIESMTGVSKSVVFGVKKHRAWKDISKDYNF